MSETIFQSIQIHRITNVCNLMLQMKLVDRLVCLFLAMMFKLQCPLKARYIFVVVVGTFTVYKFQFFTWTLVCTIYSLSLSRFFLMPCSLNKPQKNGMKQEQIDDDERKQNVPKRTKNEKNALNNKDKMDWTLCYGIWYYFCPLEFINI